MAREDTREDFPLLTSGIAYLDNGATTQKPEVVLRAMDEYYRTSNANVHRGIYALADASTRAYEHARHVVAGFLHCSDEEVIFTSGTTHAMNLAAHLLEPALKPGDEILTTLAEHHSTFIPFQQLALRTGCKLIVVPLQNETITVEQINDAVNAKTKIIALAHTSNVLGYTLALGDIKKRGAVLVVDAAQSIVHAPVKLGEADLIAFSGHKAYGPMGIGVLAGHKKLLRDAPPLLYGGSMIQNVTVAQSTWAGLPQRFEAGTPNVAGAVGLAAALEYYTTHRKEALKREQELTLAADAIIRRYARVIGPAKRSAPIISFIVPGAHAHDVAQLLDSYGVCVRAGHHCCQPLHDALSVEASVRVSLALYNTNEDLIKLEQGLAQVRKVFG